MFYLINSECIIPYPNTFTLINLKLIGWDIYS